MGISPQLKYKYLIIPPLFLLFLLFLFPIVIDYIQIHDKFFNLMLHTTKNIFGIGYRGGLVVSILLLSLELHPTKRNKTIIVVTTFFIVYL